MSDTIAGMNKPIPKPADVSWAAILGELKAAGVTQTAVANHCDCAKSTISELANGIATRDPGYSIGLGILQLHKKNCK